MASLSFYIVDVFGEKKYSGNQLAVFRNTAGLSTDQMQQMAREINFAESTFIDSDRMQGGGFNVRIFTPATELPFAGHPTLGTAFIIHQKILKKAVPVIHLNYSAGQIPVSMHYDDKSQPEELWMRQLNPVFGEVLPADPIAAILGLKSSDLDARFPVQFVSTGVPFVIVPLKTLEAVKRARLNFDKYEEGISLFNSKLIFFFAPETYYPGHQLNARMFAPEYAVVEDAATGSANGCLAGYLIKHRYFDSPEIDIRVEQGYEMDRPSLLMLKAAEISDQKIEVRVGGKVFFVAEGKWEIG
jgi:trans-2,3-dihydro-3-hydroxyanthranilate isomerase